MRTRRRHTILGESDWQADRANAAAEVFARSAAAAGVAVLVAGGLSARQIPGDPFGYLVTAGVALAGGYAVRSTWAEYRRARRRATAWRGFGIQVAVHLLLHGRPAGVPDARRAVSPGKDARASPQGG